MPLVAVIGAGVVGAAVAYWLAEQGAEVVLLDRSGPGSGATAASFASVSASEQVPRAYFDLSVAAMEEYQRLAWRLAPAPWYHVDGSLVWYDDPARAAQLEAQVQRLQEWGYAAELLPARTVLADLEPGLAGGSLDRATAVAWFPEEGWVDAPAMTGRLVEGARNAGGRVLTGGERAVVAIGTESGRVSAVTLQGGQTIPVAAVVNAAGTEASRIAALLGRRLPLAGPLGLAVRVQMPDSRNPLRRRIKTERIAVRPDGPGHVFLVPLVELSDVPEGPLSLDDPFVTEVMAWGAAAVPALAEARPVAALVRAWPILEDGLPSLGAVPSIPGYVEAVTDYGVTLAPLIGRALADEVLGQGANPLFAPFRPGRFATD